MRTRKRLAQALLARLVGAVSAAVYLRDVSASCSVRCWCVAGAYVVSGCVAQTAQAVTDEALFRRRAGGEPFRDLAPDYGVRHTTLSRYFARPEAAKELKRMERLLRAE